MDSIQPQIKQQTDENVYPHIPIDSPYYFLSSFYAEYKKNRNH